MENELILLKHFIEEDNIKAAIDKEKEIELKYKRDENKELYQKSTEIFELLKVKCINIFKDEIFLILF